MFHTVKEIVDVFAVNSWHYIAWKAGQFTFFYWPNFSYILIDKQANQYVNLN